MAIIEPTLILHSFALGILLLPTFWHSGGDRKQTHTEQSTDRLECSTCTHKGKMLNPASMSLLNKQQNITIIKHQYFKDHIQENENGVASTLQGLNVHLASVLFIALCSSNGLYLTVPMPSGGFWALHWS